MGRKANRAPIWAIAVSLMAHLALLASAGNTWLASPPELAFPIEASLLAPESPPSAPPKSRVSRARAPSPPPAPIPAPEPEAVATTEPEPRSPAVAEPLPAVEPEVVPAPPPVEPPAAKAPTRPVVRALADNLTIHYSVQTGEGDAGFVAGRATYIWQSRNGRYSLVGTVEATGLAALFISGRIVQVSEGGIDAAGLRPEQYRLQRNERKQDVARFNWAANQLVLEGRGGQPLSAQAQDLLSFPFHLAMTASEGEADFVLGVTNGRKFNAYGFRVLGREQAELKGKRLETLHIQGAREGEGALDVWLDLSRSGLPVRIRTLDNKGKTMELRLEGVGKPADGSGG